MSRQFEFNKIIWLNLIIQRTLNTNYQVNLLSYGRRIVLCAKKQNKYLFTFLRSDRYGYV